MVLSRWSLLKPVVVVVVFPQSVFLGSKARPIESHCPTHSASPKNSRKTAYIFIAALLNGINLRFHPLSIL